jgi:transcription elongation factor GreA
MITKLGKLKLEEKIKELQEELRRTYEQRSEAAAEGDLKENSAYIFMGERSAVLNTQIDEAKTDLKLSAVANPPTQTDTIVFGSRATIKFENDQRLLTFVLVGKNDARLQPDWISIESPLGIAVLNHHKSDKVLVNDQPVTIVDISIGNI